MLRSSIFRNQYKFDPMDFETFNNSRFQPYSNSINLILWILKPDDVRKILLKMIEYKFDPMDFETEK